MLNSSVPVLIVGKGIAGTTMAFRLFQNNIPFHITDRDNGKHSSAVASGLINPVVVKTFGLTWRATELIPEAWSFYRYMENITQRKFFYPQDIFRVMQDQQQIEIWNKKRNDKVASQFMVPAPEKPPKGIPSACKGGRIIKSARVDIPVFLEATSLFLKKKKILTEQVFRQDELKKEQQGWIWKNNLYRYVIFCQGIDSRDSPFAWVPVNPLKGQLMNVEVRDFQKELIVSGKIFLLPLQNSQWKAGATYERTSEPGNTKEGIDFLTEKLRELLRHNNFGITEKFFGFRPAIPDRKPVLGEHPLHKGMFIFNGLGSKGYMMAPWLSQKLYDHVFGQQPIPGETDVKRFWKT